MKRFTLALILLIVCLTLFACNKKDAAIEETVEEKPIETPAPESEPKLYPASYPLTGIGTDEDIDYRAFGVMIENSRSARPQSGLYQADLVYEVLSEASITRLLAFFHSEKPEKIGPVRSARDYYIHLNNGYNGIYVSAGGSPKARDMLEKKVADHINGLIYDGKFLWRSADRKAPHNLYTSYENLVSAADERKYSFISNIPSLPISDEPFSGEKADNVSISYGHVDNNVEYKFAEAQGRYTRFVGGTQNVDLETRIPVYVDNIFIVEMKHEVVDNDGRREIDIKSGGNGILVQNGVYQNVQWENVNGQILPATKELGFIKGKTWINVVPSLDKNVSINEQ